jgi:hypothetical protein
MSDVTKITVNGHEYDSVGHMPPDVREVYLKAMAALGETGTQKSGATQKNMGFRTVKESFTYNGREYQSRDELPPEVRAFFDKIPPLSPDNEVSDVKIITDRTIIPERRSNTLWGLTDDHPERDPKVAWLLVTILSFAVIVLLFLLYLSRHKGG